MHIAAVVTTIWVLMLNGAVGYQLIEDGTRFSISLIVVSSTIIFVGTGYIALDTGFSWTGYFDDTLVSPNKAYALYTLYQLFPLVLLFVFFVLEANLVLRILGELMPMSTWSQTPRPQFPKRLTRDFSLALGSCSSLCTGPNISIRNQRSSLQCF